MENKANTHIAQQLEELDTLPAGYQPNLDSKWALLESALEKPVVITGRFVFIKRLSIAASLLLLAGIGWWMNLKYNQPVAVIIKNDLPAKKMQQTPTIKEQQTDKIKIADVAKPGKKSLALKQEKIIVAKNDAPAIIPVAPLQKKDSGSVNVLVPVAEIAQEKSKKKKQRYVQMDFDGGNPDNNSQNEQNSTAFFKIRLNHNTTNDSGAAPENTSPFKIKYNF